MQAMVATTTVSDSSWTERRLAKREKQGEEQGQRKVTQRSRKAQMRVQRWFLRKKNARQDTSVLNYLLKDVTTEELRWMMKGDASLQPFIYIVERETLSTRQPAEGELPLPVMVIIFLATEVENIPFCPRLQNP